MSTLTIPLDDARLEQLQQTAQQLGIAVEELVNRSIDDFLARRQQIRGATDYVLQKNAELYRRLAQ